jgi:shikimate dehydrogenase
VNISGKTKIYGIIGNPVEHSLSPLFQSWFLDKSGLDATYVPFCVQESDVESAVRGLWALNVQGFNVTVPHKESVLSYVNPDESATLIGAVNTVLRGEAGWQATNTDWIGFSAALEALEADIQSASVLLFGAGGTAKAVIYALSKMNISTLYICNRTQKRAEMLAAHTRDNYSHISCELIEWDNTNVEAVSLKAGVVINATSIGLKDGDTFPFALPGEGVAVDAVYRPDGDTPFCQAARRSGRESVDGLPMLIAQGAASFSQWHDSVRPDRLEALRWTEALVGRPPMNLPGWEKQL